MQIHCILVFGANTCCHPENPCQSAANPALPVAACPCSVGPPVMFVVNDLNVSEAAPDVNHICSVAGCDQDSLLNQARVVAEGGQVEQTVVTCVCPGAPQVFVAGAPMPSINAALSPCPPATDCGRVARPLVLPPRLPRRLVAGRLHDLGLARDPPGRRLGVAVVSGSQCSCWSAWLAVSGPCAICLSSQLVACA